jgi:hypothetical protein
MNFFSFWKVRLSVSISMILIAFLAMLFSNFQSDGGWDVWKWLVPFYALASIWLGWHIKKNTEMFKPIHLIQDLMHWAAIACAIFLVSYLHSIGIVSSYIASIFEMIILSLGLVIAGIYVEKTLLFIGATIGIFAVVAALLAEYMFVLLIPVVIAAILGVTFWIWYLHKKTISPKD